MFPSRARAYVLQMAFHSVSCSNELPLELIALAATSVHLAVLELFASQLTFRGYSEGEDGGGGF